MIDTKISFSQDKDGAKFTVGACNFVFNNHQLEALSRLAEGGHASFVLLDDLIDFREVEVMTVRGRPYTKSDLKYLLAGDDKGDNIMERLNSSKNSS